MGMVSDCIAEPWQPGSWEGHCWRTATAPAKAPPEVVKWLETETIKVLSTPDMKEKLYKAGFQARPKGGADAWARLGKEITMFKDIIQKAGIQKM